jgi:uracil-DNA glycosylase
MRIARFERSGRAPLEFYAASDADRLSALSRPEFVRLERYRADIAVGFGPCPHFDPNDGGDHARLLMLLETPGPGLPEPRFVSRDNPTGTGRNIRRFFEAAGISRKDTILWNAVPWILHAPGSRNRAPRRMEIEAGLTLLPSLLSLLPLLRVVVMAGRTAALAEPVLRAARPDLRLLRAPHPSPTFVNTSPAVSQRIATALSEASASLARLSDSRFRSGPCPERSSMSSRCTRG